MKKGFTLIEMVIVIAVLAILAAVIIPLFSGFQMKARTSQVITDAKNVATAMDTLMIESAAGIYPTDKAEILKIAGLWDNGKNTEISRYGARISLALKDAGGFALTESVDPQNTKHTATYGRADGQSPVVRIDDADTPANTVTPSPGDPFANFGGITFSGNDSEGKIVSLIDNDTSDEYTYIVKSSTAADGMLSNGDTITVAAMQGGAEAGTQNVTVSGLIDAGSGSSVTFVADSKYSFKIVNGYNQQVRVECKPSGGNTENIYVAANSTGYFNLDPSVYRTRPNVLFKFYIGSDFVYSCTVNKND